MARIIVFGNEKGGSGKTTSAMHTIVTLLKMNYKVASMDLDIRQSSLSTYIENRDKTMKSANFNLLMPDHILINKLGSTNHASAASQADRYDESEKQITEALTKYNESHDFIVIDTPGSDTPLSRFIHSYADIIVTPINDSFVDIDLLGKIDGSDFNIIKPGIYSAMVFEQKMRRAARDKKEVDWVVIRNRLSSLDTNNGRNIDLAVTKLSKKFGFRVAQGFRDRVIFKELFLCGLTLHDAGISDRIKLSHSVIAARQELREFISALAVV